MFGLNFGELSLLAFISLSIVGAPYVGRFLGWVVGKLTGEGPKVGTPEAEVSSGEAEKRSR